MNRLHASLVVSALALAVLASPAVGQRKQPWRTMDYGPFLTMSVEVGPGNIAQKGICIRVDDGEGGVSAGKAFVCFDTDTLRYAAAWGDAGFIDWRGIVFNGAHNQHPKIVGQRTFTNPNAPGWGRPGDGSFEDTRIRGVDRKAYGPLPRTWGRWAGLSRIGDKILLCYDVGKTRILEVPGLMGGDARVFTRSLEISPSEESFVMQVAHEDGGAVLLDRATLAVAGADADASERIAILPVEAPRAAVGNQLDFGAKDFTITAWIKTTANQGTIISKAAPDGPWVAKGKTFFVRGGRLGYDVGWVGVVQGRARVADGKWHHVAVTHRANNGRTRLFVDGKADGDGELPSPDGDGHVVRLGYTATTFMTPFNGLMDDVRVYRRALRPRAIARLAKGDNAGGKPEAHWPLDEGKGRTAANVAGPAFAGELKGARWVKGRDGHALRFDGNGRVRIAGRGTARVEKRDPVLDQTVVAAMVVGDVDGVRWVAEGGDLRLRFPARGELPRRVRVLHWRGTRRDLKQLVDTAAASGPADSLVALVVADNPPREQKILTTKVRRGDDKGPFAVDELTLPNDNPWKSWIRLGGFDFFEDGDRAAVASWQGDVWIVSGLKGLDASDTPELRWQRVAGGLFQPLGLKIKDEKIYVLGRDQITRLIDHNGDGETDFYANFNNDAQVTEHFHEFAMDLQTGANGDFYYMKGARHAKTGVVPHHGTLLKVSADGAKTEIIARGFRAPNGLCVSPDGTFLTSDQEGHWTPMNRINFVRTGGFYGNMMAYCPDRKDTSHDVPLCWIHKNVDRSPAAQLWVTSPKWAPLHGAMLSLSYGTGRIWNVLHEKVGDVVQGGVVRLPMPEFPTGIQRGRFHPDDGQLYACGLFGWSSNKTRPGGFYRIRRTEQPLDVPTSLHVVPSGVVLGFATPLDAKTAVDPRRYRVERWNYKRTRNYGSRDWKVSDGERGRDRVTVAGVRLSKDGRAVHLQLPDMGPCHQMEINYRVKSADGRDVAHKVHHTIHALGDGSALRKLGFDGDATAKAGDAPGAKADRRGLVMTVWPAGSGARPGFDRRVARLPALRVTAGESPSPFVAPGAFVAEWSGWLDVDVPGVYRFHVRLEGEVDVTVDGREVLRTRGDVFPVVDQRGQPVELLAGPSPIRVRLRSRPDGSGRLDLGWSSDAFPREPLPVAALRHESTPELVASVRRDVGRELFATRGCASCHELSAGLAGSLLMPELDRADRTLDGIGGRVHPGWMHAWMLAPKRVRNLATMPAMLTNDDAGRREAADITAYLASQVNAPPPVQTDPPGTSLERGHRLWDDLGCVSCHTFKGPGSWLSAGDRHSLHFTSAKFRPGALRAFLADPAGTPMPDFGLDPAEAASLAKYVRSRSQGKLPPPPAGDVDRGRKAFYARGCGTCHPFPGEEPAPLERAGKIRFGSATDHGCVGRSRAAGTPHFHFNDEQRASLQAFLNTNGKSLGHHAPAAAAERAIKTARCTSCHDRDGVVAPRMGLLLEHGRPGITPEALPSLTHAGEKLRTDYLRKLLADAKSPRARPWMRARMPAFSALQHVVSRGLGAGHGMPVVDPARPPADAAMAAHGKQLSATDGGFSCVQCHGVGARDAFGPFGDRGVNFTHVADRLRYDFYTRWMFAPQRVDPRTKMPVFSSNRRTTVVRGVLGGHAGKQFDALWHWLQTSPKSSRALVRRWTVAELAPRLPEMERGRSFASGEKLFTEMSCVQCHQVKGKGGTIGPDLTKIGEKHQPLALLTELLEPSKVIEEKYKHHTIFTKDDDIVTGLLVGENQRQLRIVENALDPKDVVTVLKKDIAERRLSDVSPMAPGLVDTLKEAEILDLLAYIRSGGDPDHPAFKER